MQAVGFRLGIDFGTSHTVAVLRWPDGRAKPLLFDGSPMLPSAVYLDADGRFVVGRDALDSGRLHPSRLEPNPKRRVDDSSILLGEREVAVVDAIGAVLAVVYAEAHRIAGEPPAVVTLTCPAAWGTPRRRVLLDAAARGGLGEVRLVEEPVAAATYFAQVLGHAMRTGSAVVVYDLGGGTFDVSLVERTAGGFRTRAVDGRDDIGGLDLDEALVRRIGELYGRADPAGWHRLLDPVSAPDRRLRRLFRDDVRAVKERLSRHPTADLHIPALDRDVHVTREEFERLAGPLLEQTIQLTVRVAGHGGFPRERLAGVFLVGGASRIPLVATLVHRGLATAPTVLEQPELVVAEGSILVQSTLAVSRDPAAPVSPGSVPAASGPTPPAAPTASAAPPSIVLSRPAPVAEPSRQLTATTYRAGSAERRGRRWSDGRRRWLAGAGAALAAGTAVVVALTQLPDQPDGGKAPGETVPAVCALATPVPGATPARSGAPGPTRAYQTGWETYQDPSGFRIGYLKDWRRLGSEVCFGNVGEGRFLGVSQWRQSGTDPRTELDRKERQIAGQLARYQKVYIRPTEIRSPSAAEWQFTFDDEAGTSMRAIAIAFVAPGERGYLYFWATKESVWSISNQHYSQLHATFVPAV